MDANGVFDRCFDKANSQLSTTAVVGTATVSNKAHDANWIWAKVFDQATNTIRVIAV